MRRERASLLALASIVGATLVLATCGREEREAASPWFRDEARLRGLDFQHRSGFAERPLLPEIVAGGAALADVDGDGDLDAYLVQAGWHLEGGAAAQRTAAGNRLYLNRGDGHFDLRSGSAADTGYGMGVATGDYDNDGDNRSLRHQRRAERPAAQRRRRAVRERRRGRWRCRSGLGDGGSLRGLRHRWRSRSLRRQLHGVVPRG